MTKDRPRPAPVTFRPRLARGGPMALGAVLPPITRPVFRRHSPDGAVLMAEWAAAVGPALAAVTRPERLAAGTLTLACAGPVAMELTHLAPQLLQRLNAHLGRTAVTRLRIVQKPVATPPAPPSPAPAAPLPPDLAARLATVADPGLRAALARLAGGVCARR